DTLCVKVGADAAQAITARALAEGANLRTAWNDYLCITLDETTTRADVELLWRAFATAGQALPSIAALDATPPELIPAELRRSSAFLT
ncbi:hypothetical protein AAEH85_21910, partial [Shewanella algae]|uniref:hypothetical protein n=1 Tax=Shewanella algae TaxID=38313 RepID=UPI00313D9D67